MTTGDPNASPATASTLAAWLADGNLQALVDWLDDAPSSDVVHAVSRLSDPDRDALFSTLDAERAAALLELLPEPQQVETIETLAPRDAALIVHELPSAEKADLIAEVENAEDILAELPAGEAAEIRSLAGYGFDTAGGLMVTEYYAFHQDLPLRQVVKRVHESATAGAKYDVQYFFVVDGAGRLVGVLPLREVLLSPASAACRDRMIRDPLSVGVDDPLDRLVEFFDDHGFLGAPVVTPDGLLVGVVRQAAVLEATNARSDSDFSKSQGIVGGDELRSMPVLRRSGRRLSWLSLNVVLNLAGATVIARHQDTIEAAIALAVFLPIISDMSGCSGNQAVAVSMREMALNVTRPEDWLRVWGKELSVGLLNGLALGVLLGALAWAWQGDPVLGAVVGGALAVNTVVAASIGGVVPLVLKGLRLDPALAAGPILTTVTDVCGFFLVLSLAAATMDKLA